MSDTPMTGPAPTRQQFTDTVDPGRENRRVEWTARLVTHAPMLAKLPGLAHDLVAEADARGTEALNNLVTDARDTQAFMALKRDIGLFSQRDPEDQRINWDKMPRQQQQAYQRNGYQPPVKSDGQLMHMGLGPLGNPFTDKLGDLWNDTGGKVVTGAGDLASAGLHTLDVVAHSPAALYRDVELNGMDALNPAHFVDNWRSTWAGEKVFDPDVARGVRETFDDEDAYRYVARLASGETVADIAKDFGAPGTPGYGQGYAQMQDFAQNALVQDGVKKLAASHISPGRDLANGLGLKVGTPGYSLISGGADFAFTFLLDPTILAGKAHKAYMAAKWGLEIADETASVAGRIDRVRSFFNPSEFRVLDDRVIRDVTDPGYWAELANTKVDKPARMAAAIADHVQQGEYLRLQQAVPETSAMIETLEDYQRSTHGAIKNARDVARFYEKQVGATAIANGTYANYLGEYNALPRLSGWGAMRINDKVAWSKAIDFLDDAPVRLTSALEAGETVAPMDKLITSLQLDHIAGGYKKLTTLIPSVPYLAFEGAQTPETLSRLLDFGVTGEQRHILFNDFITAGTDEARRNIMRNVYRTIFTNIGAYDDPKYGPLVKRWLETDLQKFALDDLDIVEGASGRAPAGIWEVDRAKAVAIPQFREISAAMRRDRLTGFLTNTVNSHFAEQFMRYWKPAVLLRPAFALRVAADEALLQFARFGLDHPVKSWVTLPLGGKQDEVPLWFSERMHTGADAIFHMAEQGYGHTIYGGLASAIAGGVDRAAEALELPNTTALLRRAARATLSRADVVAYRDLQLAHEAVQAERARMAKAAGLDPKVFKALHPRQWRELAEYDFVHRAYAEIGGVDLGVLGSGVRDDHSIIEINRGTTDAPRTIRLRATGSEYDVYTRGKDELMLPIYGNTVGRLQQSPVAHTMVVARQMRVDEQQARRIASNLGTSGADDFDEVARARDALSDLPESIRWRLLKWADGGDDGLIDNALSRIRPGEARTIVQSFTETGRWARHDMHAVLVDSKRAGRELEVLLGAAPDAPWRAMLKASQRGDLDASHWLEEKAAEARMKMGDVAGDYANLDRNARHITDAMATKLEHPDLVSAVGSAWLALRSTTATEEEVVAALDHLRPFAESVFPGRFARIVDREGMDELIKDLSIDQQLPTLSSRLADNAVIQRKALDQLLLSESGENLHEMMRPLADGKFSYVNHVDTADLSRLPSRVHGPVLEEVAGDTTAERVTRWGFDHISHTIAAISRRPLWHRMYANAWEQAESQVGPYLRDAALGRRAERVVGDLDKASDALWEATMSLSPTRRGGGADALSGDEIRQALSGVPGYKDTPTGLLTVRDWWRNEQMTREQLSRIAMTRATRDITPFIHDAKLRSQFAENARNIFPFWFAQEQFFKRWGRTIAAAPEAIRRVQMAHHALQATGWVERNEQGEEVFVYPGAEFVTNAIARAAEIIWPGSEAFTLPIAAALTGQLQYASPGYDSLDRGGLPAPGPTIAITVSALRRLDPETFAPVEEAIMGPRGARRSLPDIMIPPVAMKLYRAVTADEKQLASATIGAMQMLDLADKESKTAGGKGISFLPDESAPDFIQQKEDYLSRIKHWARILLFTRALVGAVGPAAPSPELDPDHLSPEYLALIRSGMPIEEATRRFLVEHPDATAYMIFASTSPSSAPTDPTSDAYKVLTDNEGFFRTHRAAGAWLLPDGTDQGFDQKAWDSLFALKLRERRTTSDFYDEIKFREAAPDFYAEQARKDAIKARYKGNGAAERRIDDIWASWRDDYLAQHPTFADRYQNPAGPDRRKHVLADLRLALEDPAMPKVEHAPMLANLVKQYDNMNAALDRYKDDTSTNGRDARLRIRQIFDTWATAFSAAHPTVDAFFRRILEPDLKLPTTGASTP